MQGEDGDIEVTELPLRKWTQDYKEWLDSMVKPDKDAKDQTAYISDYKCVSCLLAPVCRHRSSLQFEFRFTLLSVYCGAPAVGPAPCV